MEWVKLGGTHGNEGRLDRREQDKFMFTDGLRKIDACFWNPTSMNEVYWKLFVMYLVGQLEEMWTGEFYEVV